MKRRPGEITPPADEPWRVLTENERALLEVLLMPTLGETRRLLAQIPYAEARSGCTCGCGTIALHVPPDVPRADGAAGMVEGDVFDATGQLVGGLILWVQDGLIEGLEIYSYPDPAPPLPRAENVRPLPNARIDR